MRREKSPPTDKLRTNLFGMLLAVIGFGLLTGYLTMTLSTQDPLWFTNRFETLPVRLVVYQAGQETEYIAGKPGYAELAEAVRECLAQGSPRTSGLGLSQISLDDAYRKYVTLEAFFDRPVKLHAPLNTGLATQMLFPITGRHADRDVVFLGKDGTYFSNAPVLRTTEPIRAVLRSLGYETETAS